MIKKSKSKNTSLKRLHINLKSKDLKILEKDDGEDISLGFKKIKSPVNEGQREKIGLITWVSKW